jgi:hypothetical protein
MELVLAPEKSAVQCKNPESDAPGAPRAAPKEVQAPLSDSPEDRPAA